MSWIYKLTLIYSITDKKLRSKEVQQIVHDGQAIFHIKRSILALKIYYRMIRKKIYK